MNNTRGVRLAVLVAALGYFVDVYDLLLFGIIRVQSLKDLGLSGPDFLDQGVFLFNMQMGGMLIGGILWGILGDRRGRLSVLFGSIVMYSAANIANGFVQGITSYAIVRFFAGVGLAGELGAGITLVAELMRKETRGYATTIVASVGVCGAIAAAKIGKLTDWRTAYFIGGGLGIGLLLLRMGVLESGIFEALKKQTVVRRGNFFSLFSNARRRTRYLSIIMVGVPIWYCVSILVTFSPELGRSLGMKEAPDAGQAVFYCYIGIVIGDICSGLLSQALRARKKVIGTFVLLTAGAIVVYFTVGPRSLPTFYASCTVLGLATGYWAVFMTMASEQFGTNIRATVTTTVPNFVRGAVVPITMLFQALKAPLGVPGSAIAVGVMTLGLALLALRGLEETYGKDLDFVEE